MSWSACHLVSCSAGLLVSWLNIGLSMLAGQLISWLAGLQIPKSFLFKYELNIIVYNFFILMIQIVVSLQKYFPQC